MGVFSGVTAQYWIGEICERILVIGIDLY